MLAYFLFQISESSIFHIALALSTAVLDPVSQPMADPVFEPSPILKLPPENHPAKHLAWMHNYGLVGHVIQPVAFTGRSVDTAYLMY
jgi:hypothetical protein